MDQFGVLVESIGFKSQSRSTPLSKLKSQPNKPNFQNPPTQQAESSNNLGGFQFGGNRDDKNANFFDFSKKSNDSFSNDDVFGVQFGGSNASGGGNGVDLDAFFVGSSSSGLNGDDDDIFGLNSRSNLGENRRGSDDLLSGFDSSSQTNIFGGNTDHSVQSSAPPYSSFGEDHFSIFESSSSKNSSTIDELEAFAKGSSQNNGSQLGGKISNEAITRVQEKLSNMKCHGMKGKSASDSNIKVSLPVKGGRESKVTPGGVSVRGQTNEAKNTFGNEDSFGVWFSDDSQSKSSRGPKPEIKDDVLDSLFNVRNQSNVENTSSQPRVTKKASLNKNHVNDFLFFGEPASSAVEFHEIEGEPEERRRARFNQHMRTKERMAKALSEKNQRDLQAQHEQEERRRSAESMDSSIKRWAAGKEGNLRALLSSLQEVLWPECGWQTVSLTDMITSVSVKKVYHKATLCVHPDKVQQKGATVQQKYIAEKVFDILKESWNKFNAEELR